MAAAMGITIAGATVVTALAGSAFGKLDWRNYEAAYMHAMPTPLACVDNKAFDDLAKSIRARLGAAEGDAAYERALRCQSRRPHRPQGSAGSRADAALQGARSPLIDWSR